MYYKVYVFISILVISQFPALPLHSEDARILNDPARLEHLKKLNQQVQEEGKRNNYPQVEKMMGEMIDLMAQLNFPPEKIREHAHIRIRYSQSLTRFGPARESAKQWLKKHPDDIVALELLGDLAFDLNLGLEARKAYQKVYEASPANGVIQKKYLHLLNLMNDRDAALPVCEQVLKTHPDDRELLKRVIEAYLRFEKKEQVFELIDRLQSLAPENPFLNYARGRAYYESGKTQSAIDCLKKVPDRTEYWFDANFHLGMSLAKLRQNKEAANIYVQLLSVKPYDIKVLTSLARCLARLRNKDAVLLITKIKKKIDKRGLIEGEANYLWRTGDMNHFAQLRTIAENQKGDFRRAQQLLIGVCFAMPKSYLAKENLALHHLTTLQACRAEKIFHRLIDEATPGQKHSAILNLSQAQLRQGRPAQTLELLKRTPEKDPLKRSLFGLIGTYYLDIESDPKQAIPYLENVKDATSAVLSSLARSYLECGELDKANRTFTLIPDGFNDPKTWFSKVQCLAGLGRIEEASSLYDRSIAADPNLSPLVTIPAQAAIAQVNNATDRDTWVRRAKHLNDTLTVIRQKVIEANRTGWPKSVPTLIELSDHYLEIGDKDNALRFAQLAFEGNRRQPDLQVKIIQLMDRPEQIFERLYRIEIARQNKNIKHDFKPEISEALSHIGLVPSH